MKLKKRHSSSIIDVDDIKPSHKNNRRQQKRSDMDTENSKRSMEQKMDFSDDGFKQRIKENVRVNSNGTPGEVFKQSPEKSRITKNTNHKKLVSCKMKKCYIKALCLNHKNLKSKLKFMKKPDADIEKAAKTIHTQLQQLQKDQLQYKKNSNDENRGSDGKPSSTNLHKDKVNCKDFSHQADSEQRTLPDPTTLQNYVDRESHKEKFLTSLNTLAGNDVDLSEESSLSSNDDEPLVKADATPKLGRIPKLKGTAEELRKNRHVPVSAKMNQRSKIMELLHKIEEFKPIIQKIADSSIWEKRPTPELGDDVDIEEIDDLNDDGWKELKSLKEESEIFNYFKKRYGNGHSSSPLINLSFYGGNSLTQMKSDLSQKNLDTFDEKFNVVDGDSVGEVK